MSEILQAEQKAWRAYRAYCAAHSNVANWIGDETSRSLYRLWRPLYARCVSERPMR